MSARHAGATAALKSISIDASELTADTTPRPSGRHLAVVWRNPRSNDLVPTGSVGLEEVRPLGGLLSAPAFLETDFGMLAHSKLSFPETPFATGDIWGNRQFQDYLCTPTVPAADLWGNSQFQDYLYTNMVPAADLWGNSQIENAWPGTVLISTDLRDVYQISTDLQDTHKISTDLKDICQYVSYMPNAALPVTTHPLQSGRIEMQAGDFRDRSLEQKLRVVFQRGTEERFEDGMESEFAKELEGLVRASGPNFGEILGRIVEEDPVSSSVKAEAIGWISRTNALLPRAQRISILERALGSGSALVRDSAAVGLASMDATEAIAALARAFASEQNTELKSDIEELIRYLRGL